MTELVDLQSSVLWLPPYPICLMTMYMCRTIVYYLDNLRIPTASAPIYSALLFFILFKHVLLVQVEELGVIKLHSLHCVCSESQNHCTHQDKSDAIETGSQLTTAPQFLSLCIISPVVCTEDTNVMLSYYFALFRLITSRTHSL